MYRNLPEEDPADDGPPPLVDQPAAGGGAGGSGGGGGGDSEGSSSFEEDPAYLDWLAMLSRGEDPGWPSARFVSEKADAIMDANKDSMSPSTTNGDTQELMAAAWRELSAAERATWGGGHYYSSCNINYMYSHSNFLLSPLLRLMCCCLAFYAVLRELSRRK